jgi:hypothetical protein
MPHLNLRDICEKRLSRFEPFWAHLDSKICQIAKKGSKTNFISNIFRRDIKERRILA